ncbi:PDR/VanB family oxidoreductase [Tomitella biformata]|uniref:PDR/VanB family oxidoreductase n=1 Tax=Tomitella biformata TaxID=630403 RepID=UPI0004648317|nr:PDR/VanB family oxidoreductase [Tomitella biformata]
MTTENASPTATLKLISAGITAYQSVFVKSRLAPLLSRPKPVRNSGFEMALTIESVTAQGPDVISLELVDPDGGQLPSWIPGAHLDILLPSGKQRQYSLCGDPADRTRYRIAVRRIADGLGGSREMHELTAGRTIDVVGPRNAFPLIAAESYLFIAGGIGITPILPMVRQCHERGIPWKLVYLGRSRETMPFLDELAQYPSGQVEIRPDDEFGLPDVTHIIPTAAQGSAIYMCGPTPLMATARGLMREINPSGSLHTERFSALPVVGGKAFEVRLAASGITVQVAADETALAAIRREVPGVAYSCQQGFCGTCRVRVCGGKVDHRDRLLTPGERAETMLTCVSRSAGGPLVVDL